MNSLLLEKVEELTLYTIQLEKTNTRQQERLEKLEKMMQQLLQKK